MAFNELNSVEHYIIYQLAGANLYTDSFSEPDHGHGVQWHQKSLQELDHLECVLL